MPLHRDIHWLGRQWAVTGHGLQLINQKQMGYYDIEVARLWEAGVIEAMQGKAWINRPDFDKAVEIARARFAHTAPAGIPLPSAPESSPPPAEPTATRPRAELPSGPTLEELLARLKARSAVVVPAAQPIDLSVVEPQPEPPRSEPAKVEPPKAESLKAEPAKIEPAKAEPPKPEAPKPEAPKPQAALPEAPRVMQAAPEVPQPASKRRITLELRPTDFERPKPAWPVFDRKIAGSARFVRPWRARLTGWKGTLPGLPPRL
ncbi:hypothetical protein AS156_39455 [Bradyrhizobium macuxiense]|uniref:Uncharacterized protein n=1 Tax=Bradyrhizobium macuxiense TaxID=1755647 RepID=A0A109JYH3_9BRAD|nr:hypothetical protein [Bradyrhizobium macuxiense]KWV57391.1 hypothetical protein AS156_39455 [Bradyrhizobium macuxiense]